MSRLDILFQLSPNFDITGVVMISLALVADAVIGNVQEKTIKQYNASNSEVTEWRHADQCKRGFIILKENTHVACHR